MEVALEAKDTYNFDTIVSYLMGGGREVNMEEKKAEKRGEREKRKENAEQKSILWGSFDITFKKKKSGEGREREEKEREKVKHKARMKAGRKKSWGEEVVIIFTAAIHITE